MSEDQLSLWDNATTKEVSGDKLEALDATIKEYNEARAKKDEAESKYNIEEANCKVIADRLLSLLKTVGRDSFETPGVGTAYISHRQNFTTPKLSEDKVALFNYIKQKYGEESLRGMISINSMTLNSWAKREVEGGVLTIPGLGQPTATEILGFRKK